jgi:hypothetical protein
MADPVLCSPHPYLETAVTKSESNNPVILDVDSRGVARVVLNRPERNNFRSKDM